MWDPQWPVLRAEFRVLRCDLRGYGRSPLGGARYRDAGDVRDVLDAAGLDAALLVGSSLGARVALEIAACYPRRVAGLVLVCPAFRFGQPTPAAQAFAERERALLAAGDLDAAAELNARTWLGPDADDAARRFVHQMQRDAMQLRRSATHGPGAGRASVDLAAITAPTSIVSGGKDMDHFQQVAARLARDIHHAKHHHLEWAGHLPNLERPAQTTRLLLNLLNGNR
jgi:3-oxoadipate enol-lactonase